MKTKLIVFALLLTVVSIITISFALKSCDLNPEPNREEIHEIITKKHDSIGVVVVNVSLDSPDTTGLYKLQAFKKRLAAAALRRQLDSIARLQNK